MNLGTNAIDRISAIGQPWDLADFSHTINGQAAQTLADFDVIDPATGASFCRCPDASRDQLDAAVAAARAAFPAWRDTPVSVRRAGLVRLVAMMRERAPELAVLLSREQGKPVANAEEEFLRTAWHIEHLITIDIGVERLRECETGTVDVYYRPLGVVGAIAPWNFPIVLAMWKVAHALYTGNTIVVKPSPYTPLTTLKLAELARGLLPDGVFNVVAGGSALGAWMSEHPGIDKISFTGSGPTGKRVLASCSATLKRVTLELGGNDPAIVLPDADPEAIAEGIFWGAFYNCGQICKAIKRVYVHEAIHDRLVDALANLAHNVHVGNGLDPEAKIGPLQNRVQFDIVMSMIERALAEGGRLAAGGEALAREGYFVSPTIVTGLTKGSILIDEEQFGPVLPIIRYTDVADAVAQANDTRFGLSASVWTADLTAGAQVAASIDAGTVWVNRHGGSDPFIPFGGAKESGMGRENSVLGLREYMQAVVVQIPPNPAS